MTSRSNESDRARIKYAAVKAVKDIDNTVLLLKVINMIKIETRRELLRRKS